MISLCAITEDNFDAVIRMKRPDGEGFVASNAYSLAQCWLYRHDGDVFPCAIYADETPVGFLLLEDDLDERTLTIWRIMFPEGHAGKGYGFAAITEVIRLARACGKYDRLCLDCHPDNHRARHLYEKLGFTPTGEINHGSDEMALML